MRRAIVGAAVVFLFATASLNAQWPQWRGPNRDEIVATASVPKAWSAKLTMLDFSRPVRARDNYSGPEFGLSIGWLFGRGRTD